MQILNVFENIMEIGTFAHYGPLPHNVLKGHVVQIFEKKVFCMR